MKNKVQTDLEDGATIAQEDAEPKNKKRKRFSAKEFRKSLKSENISESKHSSHHLYIFLIEILIFSTETISRIVFRVK